MSLINKMLQDLDARHETQRVRANLPSLRPLPAAPSSRRFWILAATLAGIAVPGLLVYLALHEPVTPVVLATSGTPPAVRTIISAEPQPEAHVVSEKTVEPAEPRAVPQAEASAAPETVVKKADPVESTENVAKAASGPRAPEEASVSGQQLPEQTSAHLPSPSSSPSSEAESQLAERASIKKTDVATPRQDQAESAYRKAFALAEQGRIGASLEILRDAYRANTQHFGLRQLLVKLLLEDNRGDEAMQVLREGLQAQPAQTAWAMTLARLQVDRGDLAGAAQTLHYSLPAAFDNADYLGFSGHLQQRLGKGKEAAKLYQAATRLAPDDGRWWLGLGLAMESEERHDEAHAAFWRAQQCENLSRELAALVEQKLRQ